MEETLINIELYKQIHTDELKAKNEIDSHANLTTNLIIVLIGVALFLFQKNYNHHQSTNVYIQAAIGVLFAVLAGIVTASIIFLIKMYLNGFSKYKYLPISSDLQKIETQIAIDCKNKCNKVKKKTFRNIKIEFDKHLIKHYIDCSTNNRKVNDERMNAFYLSKLYLIISMFLIAFIGFLMIQK
ncbi:hypothetical protein SGQ83_00555 [Flavobacterium sp. Fl-318]|uniref:Uncharacterized protein n=1 Tax=Flavobacterium cupriresistens TaxID=2893885 RepID=A0ABU4R5H7_9FLAO|nr:MULTISPECIES: hypothetical protein [unclassified Flavobacterium]MDX6187827.1 hypothetical protein [Flavobacterium sp. Fl-318]UFH42251.1 hypothetical protein LNP23_20895 [Flavobacterium sp. F-323]